MAKYKIKVIQHLLKGNKMAKSGDIVDSSQFINLQSSIDGGYCEKVKGKKNKNKNKNKDKSKNQGGGTDIIDLAAEAVKTEVKSVKKLNKELLVKYAQDNAEKLGIEINPDDNKDIIQKAVVEAIEKPKKGE